jgi:pilus assembly protein CpaE
MHVHLFSSVGHQQLEELVRACGAHVRTAALDAPLAAGSGQPDALVLDLRDRRSLAVTVTALRRKYPDVGIVLVTSALETSLLVEAMRAGINEVVTDPLTREDLQHALGRIAGHRVTEIGQVFGFVGAKGGVGTTTVSVNTGTVLGSISRPGRTLLIDLHEAGGDAAVFLGVEPRFSVLDALQNVHRLDHTFFRNLVTEVAPHTDFLSSPDAPSAERTKDRLHAILTFARTMYRYTVLDLPRSDALLLDALDELSVVFVVATQELAAVRSGSRIAEGLRRRYGADKVKVVVSRPDTHGEIGPTDVKRATGCDIAQVFPNDYPRALRALNQGRPLTLDNHNDLSAAFTTFAHHLAGTTQERSPAARKGLLGRLASRRA